MRFDIFINKLLQHEGGYVNDPDDLGGETKYGITKRRYPNLDIKNLTRDHAIAIYKRDFYNPMGIDSIPDTKLAFNYFDMGVNAGKKVADNLMNEASKLQADNGGNIADIYMNLRRAYYTRIAEARPQNKKFLKGWLNRVNSSNIIA